MQADRRFIWWRWVQAEITERRSRRSVRPTASDDDHAGNRLPANFSDVLPLIERAVAQRAAPQRQRALRVAASALIELTAAVVPDGSWRFRIDDYEVELGEVAPAEDNGIVLNVFADRSSPGYELPLTIQDLRDVARQRVLLDQLIGVRIARLVEPR